MRNLFPRMTHSEEDFSEYIECVSDLLAHEAVQSMEKYTQHYGTDILEHSIYVSYLSFRICKMRGYDYRSAARGGLLHDFFLYQRRVNKPYKGWHTTGHPRQALENATLLFDLNGIEKDIIVKHMWPISLGFPRFLEGYIVSMVDKYCCVMEALSLRRESKTHLLEVQRAASFAS